MKSCDMLSLMPFPAGKARHAKGCRSRWQKDDYRANQVAAQRRSHSPEHMAKMQRAAQTKESRQKRSVSMTFAWRNPILRSRLSQHWTPENRSRQAERARAMHAKRRAEAGKQ